MRDKIGYFFKLSFSACVQVRFPMNKSESLSVTHPEVSLFTALLVNFGSENQAGGVHFFRHHVFPRGKYCS